MLGFILRKFPNFEFDMNTFDGRLRLQKFIYLLQAHDVYLGYDFSWYMRGPYCTTLATAGFALRTFYDDLQSSDRRKDESGFVSTIVQERFERFAKFIKSRERNANFLEAAASLHYRINAMRESDDAAVQSVTQKMPDTEESYVRRVLGEMRREKLIAK